MLEHERRRMSLKGLSEAETNKRMKKYATFYELYLNHQRTPAEITREHPALTEIWYDEPERHYGRPARFYHQLQALNLAEAWQRVNAPVLAVHGEYDWVMSGDDYKLLVSALNASHPGSGGVRGMATRRSRPLGPRELAEGVRQGSRAAI